MAIVIPAMSGSTTYVNQIIQDAMGVIGVIGQNETPTSSEMSLGLRMLNGMLAMWATDRTYAYSVTNNSGALVNGQREYSIGAGGDFDVTRPVTIDYAYIRLNSVDYPLKKLNNQDYGSIPYKENQPFPQFFYYDPAYPLGYINIYGVPTSDMTLFFDTWQQITQFTDIYQEVSLPPGYELAVIYSLAKILAPHYGVTLSPEAAQMEITTTAMIRDRNLPDYVMKTEVGLISGNYGYRGYGDY